jgi:hypothetical protein
MTNNKKIRVARAFWWAGSCFMICMVTAILFIAFQVRTVDWLTANTSWTAGTWRVCDAVYGMSRNECIAIEWFSTSAVSLIYAVLVFMSRMKD